MSTPFSQRFPLVTGDLGALWSSQNEIRNRRRDIRDLGTSLTDAISTCGDWRGLAREAFNDSARAEQKEVSIWEDGCLQAADALKSYYFILESVIRIVNNIRAQADELWEQYQAMPPETRSTHDAEIKGVLAYLQKSYDDAKYILSEEALSTAAFLREALYFTPEDIHEETSHGVKNTLDYGDTRSLTYTELEEILARQADPSSSLFDIDQGHIGDCHLLSTLNAYNQTEEGRKYLASLVTPHYNAQGKIDGYFVDFPGYGRNEKRVFVQDVMLYDDTAGRTPKADLASVFEKAFIQSHDGGTKSMFPHAGASASFSAITMQKISGIPGIPLVNVSAYRGIIKDKTIAAINSGHPVVAESSLFAGDAQVTADGNQENIKIASSHVYTVAAADENGVTLINPWGHNNRSGGSGGRTGATFTISWEEFYANYGDVTVGFIP